MSNLFSAYYFQLGQKILPFSFLHLLEVDVDMELFHLVKLLASFSCSQSAAYNLLAISNV